MGNTYGNVTLRGVRVDRVAAELASFERTAFLLEDGDRVAVFMPEADEDPLQVAGNLSVATGGAAALAVFVFDSDLLVTWLVVDGEIRDRYVSNAELADDELDEEGEPEEDIERSVVMFPASGLQFVIDAPRDPVVAFVHAAGFVPDERLADFLRGHLFYAGQPDDPAAFACDLTRSLDTTAFALAPQFGSARHFDRGVELEPEPTEPAAEDPRDDELPGGDAERADEGEWPRPEGGDAAELCAAFGGDPAVVEGLLRGTIPVDDPTFHAESLHAALVEALGLPAATLGVGYGHLAEGIELAPEDQARLIRVG